MQGMFSGAAAFDQDLSGLDISNIDGGSESGNSDSMLNMLDNTKLSVANYDATLIGWAAQLDALGDDAPKYVNLGASGLEYSGAGADAARHSDNWLRLDYQRRWQSRQHRTGCRRRYRVGRPPVAER